MYTTQNNRQIERQLDREEEEISTDRCIQHRTIDRQRDSQIERKGRQIQLCRQMHTTQNNRQKERQLDREKEEEGTDRCIQHRTLDRERQLDREEEEVTTDRCTQHRSIDRQIERLQHRTIDRQSDSQIGRKGRQIQLCRQMFTTQNNRQIEREFIAQNNRQIERQLDREEEEVDTDRCVQHRTIDRQRDSSIERRQAQIDVYNIEQQIDRQFDREQEENVDTY